MAKKAPATPKTAPPAPKIPRIANLPEDLKLAHEASLSTYGLLTCIYRRPGTLEFANPNGEQKSFQLDFLALASILGNENYVALGGPGTAKSQSASVILSLLYGIPSEIQSEARLQGSPDVCREDTIAYLNIASSRDGRNVPVFYSRAFLPAFLFDEINKTPTHTQAHILPILEEGDWQYMGVVVHNKPRCIATMNTGAGVFDLSNGMKNRFGIYLPFLPLTGNEADQVKSSDFKTMQEEILKCFQNGHAEEIRKLIQGYNADYTMIGNKLYEALQYLEDKKPFLALKSLNDISPHLSFNPSQYQMTINNPNIQEELKKEINKNFTLIKKPTADELFGEISRVRAEYLEAVAEQINGMNLPWSTATGGELDHFVGFTSQLFGKAQDYIQSLKLEDSIGPLPDIKEDGTPSTGSGTFISFAFNYFNYAGIHPVTEDRNKSITDSHFNQSTAAKMACPISKRNLDAAIHLSQAVSFLLGFQEVPLEVFKECMKYTIPQSYVATSDSVSDLVDGIYTEYRIKDAGKTGGDYQRFNNLLSVDDPSKIDADGIQAMTTTYKNSSPFITQMYYCLKSRPAFREPLQKVIEENEWAPLLPFKPKIKKAEK